MNDVTLTLHNLHTPRSEPRTTSRLPGDRSDVLLIERLDRLTSEPLPRLRDRGIGGDLDPIRPDPHRPIQQLSDQQNVSATMPDEFERLELVAVARKTTFDASRAIARRIVRLYQSPPAG